MSDDWMTRLSSALDLPEEPEDWGIVNATPGRLVEFIEFFKAHVALHPWDHEALAELIIASANDALDQCSLGNTERMKFADFLSVYGNLFPHQVQYWSKLPINDEFPVAKMFTDGQADATPPRS